MNRARHWRSSDGSRNGIHFFCPGCNEIHSITTEPNGWGFNGNLELPTFTPSVNVTSGHYNPNLKPDTLCWCSYKERTGNEPDFKCGVCHSFVTDGRIQFLGDCTHALANQTVDLPAMRDEESMAALRT